MEKQQIVSILKSTDLFSTLSEEALQELVSVSKQVKLKCQEVLFNFGETADSMYVILEGHIQIYRNELLLSTFSAPEYLGELALIHLKTRSASARAMDNTLLLQISHDDFHTFLETDRESVLSMMKTLSERIFSSTEQLNEAYQTVNHLIHDMKNKLSALGFANIVAREVEEGSQEKRFLDIITATKNELEHMMENALLAARGVSVSYIKDNILLTDLLEECLEQDLALSSALDDITIDWSCSNKLEPISVNAIDIKRVFVNLIVNAGQASEPGQKIDIRFEQQAEQIAVEVQDYGCGIAADKMELIFEEHYTSKTYGNGFGLSVCKNIIEQLHHGTLTVVSEPDKGTTFTFTIPNHS